jgi:hypothetical protein
VTDLDHILRILKITLQTPSVHDRLLRDAAEAIERYYEKEIERIYGKSSPLSPRNKD